MINILYHLASAMPTDTTPPTDTTSVTGNSTLDTVLPFLNFGLVGVLIVLIASKRVFVPKWSLDDAKESYEDQLKEKDAQILSLQEEKKELKQANEQLQAVAREQFLPALIEANRLTALYVETLAKRQRRDDDDGGG